MNEDKNAIREDMQALLKKPGLFGVRVDKQSLIKHFFNACAGVTIITLFLIMWSLLREGAGFLPTYRWELSVYRQAGLEYADFIEKPLSEHLALHSKLNRAFNAELNTVSRESKMLRDAALLAKQQIEEKTILQREPLQAALEAGNTAPEKIASLRQALNEANAAASASQSLSNIFNEADKKALKADLLALQPDVTDMPPFIKGLMEKFNEQDRLGKEKYATFISALDAFEEAAEPITELHDGMKEQVLSVKGAATQQHMAEDAKAQLLAAASTAKTAAQREALEKDAAQTEISPIDYKTNIDALVAKLPAYEQLVPAYKEAVSKAMEGIPQKAETPEARELITQVRNVFPKHLTHVDESVNHMKTWQWDKPVPLTRALTAFLFGGDWITNSSWQDFYGVIPLFTGSLLIAMTALVVALPLSVAAAIYTNQFASPREQELIKPCIEFIQAIPSVVLGFIGISVVGDLIKETSNIPWLQWVPGFPVQERLNMFNAGLLLAFMAIPTMFSLAEDAIQNVPRAFSEASEALGATRLQTVFRVIFPASISGVFAAMLLGLGRIIGETMVVLLVAGNRIAIPDFSDGIGAVFQPAHTLTGIIAQELGEVSRGSAHWQALFIVGILLFCISLLINFLSRKVVKRFQLPKI
ncbi:hypothetical protein BH11VER1_BH11VER1_03060 [soil metagenome]